MKQIHALSLAAAFTAVVFPISSTSANFESASAHIDLDGSMVAYMDFEGDGREIGTALNDIYQQVLKSTPQIPPIPVDFNLLIQNLGFGSLKSIAMSSKDVEPGLHRNRSVALFNDEPNGLYALYNTEKLTFTAAEKAPADATGAMTASINLGALRDTSSLIMQQIMGPTGKGMVEQQLKQVIPKTDISYNEAIDTLSGKWDGFWYQSYDEDFQQEFRFWLNIEGAGSLLSRLRVMAEDMGVAFIEDDTLLKANFSHLLGPNASFGLYVEAPKQSGALIIYSHSEWTPESEGIRLAESEVFKNLADHLPNEGMIFNYSKGVDLDPILAELSTLPQAAPYMEATESSLNLLIGDFLKPSMAVTFMEDGNMVSDQYAGYSTKQVVMAIPTIFAGGFGAAMAIPAFQKVRETSQEKAVINNLRQIASAADQHFLETGTSSVKVSELVGPRGYIRQLNPVMGENYMDMVITTDLEEISILLPNGKLISLPN